MVKYLVCYTFLFFVQLCNGTVQSLVPRGRNEIEECVPKIIQRIDNVTDVTLVNVNVAIVMALHTNLVDPVRFISRTYYWPNDTLYNNVYVIQCVDFFQFVHGLDLIKRDPFWNPRAKFVIIIEYVGDNLEDVSVFLIHNYIFDVAVITHDDENNVVVYTFGLEHDECDRPVVKTLQLFSRCSELHNTKKIYVVAKETRLRGCHVKFVAHNYWPFISFGEKHSIEQYLLKLVRQFENITVELVNFGQDENFGSRLENFTYTGMLHEIEIYNVEGAVGGYVLTLNRMQNLDFVDPYMVDYYKIVTARAKMLNKWSGVLKQLGLVVIWIIPFTFCKSCVVVTLMDIFNKKEKDRSHDILIVWGYFLNNITQKKNTKTGLPHRLVLLSILMYVFILSCATQASLLSATTHPIRDYQCNSVDEVVSNYELILSPNLYSYLKNNPVVNLSNSKRICRMTLDCMTMVMKNNDKLLYTIASDLYHESNIWKYADEHGELKIYKISEPVGTLLQTMYIRRGSSLAEPFNRLFLRARSGGFIEKFFERLKLSERLNKTFHQQPHKKPQSLKGLEGIFILLTSGCAISSITFILECWYCRRYGYNS